MSNARDTGTSPFTTEQNQRAEAVACAVAALGQIRQHDDRVAAYEVVQVAEFITGHPHHTIDAEFVGDAPEPEAGDAVVNELVKAGQKLADEGAEAAAASFAMTGTEEGRQWTVAATAILDDLIGSGEPFTAEGITSRIGPAPSPTAAGSMFREASRLGRIRPVGWSKATRAAAHARPLRVWQGN